MIYDDIIVGAGSSGAVLAYRLSEDPQRKVLLIESGPVFSTLEETPAALLDHNIPVLRGYNWKVNGFIKEASLLTTVADAGATLKSANSRFSMVKTAVQSSLKGKSVLGRFDYPVGRVSGGSSSVNGALAMRPSPKDFEQWVKRGNDHWCWTNVLAMLKKIERDYSYADDYHGKNGLVPIRHTPVEAFTPVQRAFYNACRGKNYSAAKDFNAPDASGVGAFPKNIDNQGNRISSSLSYLSAAITRENLTVLGKSQLDRVLFDNGRVKGVEAIVDRHHKTFYGNRVTLTAGFIHTPAILLRSGMAAEEDLQSLNIPVQTVLPGVGKNLVDHPVVSLWAKPKEDACPLGEPTHQALLRYSSTCCPATEDMSLFMLSAFDINVVPELRDLLGGGREGMALSAVLGLPHSIGRLQFTSASPSVSPQVYANLLQEELDMSRMVEGIQLAWDLLQDKNMQDLIDRIPVWHSKMIKITDSVEQIAKTFVRGSAHAGGTAKMGPDSDPMAVTDQMGRVKGCRGLRVADASIMPLTVRSSTNLTAMMIAEMIAESMLAGDD